MQINLQHSRTATDNIMNLSGQDKTDILFIQESYLYNCRIAGISTKNRIYTSHEDKSPAAIVINNRYIDTVLITQLSNSDCVLLEMEYNGSRFHAASMYFDITEEIERGLKKIDQMLEFTKGNGIIIAADSNARSAAWHDIKTNKRGKTMEEFIISKGLYIMNEESEWTTFHNARGKSNIDLTIVNSQILQVLTNWEICEEDSCSDHSIIKFSIRQNRKQDRQQHNYGIRYVINEQTLSRFERNLIVLVTTKFQKGKITDLASLDNELVTQTKETRDTEKAVDKLQEAITMACDNSLEMQKTTRNG